MPASTPAVGGRGWTVKIKESAASRYTGGPSFEEAPEANVLGMRSGMYQKRRGGEGVWNPKICVTRMAQINISFNEIWLQGVQKVLHACPPHVTAIRYNDTMYVSSQGMCIQACHQPLPLSPTRLNTKLEEHAWSSPSAKYCTPITKCTPHLTHTPPPPFPYGQLTKSSFRRLWR